MTRRGKGFTATFLIITGLALVTEVLFAFDGNSDTHPWTDLIVSYVPWELATAVFGALLLWVPIHFYVRYKRKRKRVITALKQRVEAGHTDVPTPLFKDALSVMSPEEFAAFKRNFFAALEKGQIKVVEPIDPSIPYPCCNGVGCPECGKPEVFNHE